MIAIPAMPAQHAYTCRSLVAIAGRLEYAQRQIMVLEGQLSVCLGEGQRQQVLADLLVARQQEQAALQDLLDGARHLAFVAGYRDEPP